VEQLVAAMPEKVPLLHRLGATLLPGQAYPGGQGTELLIAFARQSTPAEQAEQLAAPTDEKEPAVHAVAGAPLGHMSPAGQSTVLFVACAPHRMPGVQAAQTSALLSE